EDDEADHTVNRVRKLQKGRRQSDKRQHPDRSTEAFAGFLTTGIRGSRGRVVRLDSLVCRRRRRDNCCVRIGYCLLLSLSVAGRVQLHYRLTLGLVVLEELRNPDGNGGHGNCGI